MQIESRYPMQDGIQSIDELTLENQRVFIRADFDLPLKRDGLASNFRLKATLPTLEKARRAGARVVLGSHLGRPRGRPRPDLSLEVVGSRLCELLHTEIYLPDESIGDAARKVVQDLRPGQICLLENLGFCAEEQANDENFCRKLAQLADVFVNDAPRTLGERFASTVGLPPLFRQRGMGYLLAAELATFSKLRDSTERPFVAVIGGAGKAERLALIEWLIGRADTICVGGILGNTLASAGGSKLGASLVDRDSLARGRALLARARERNTNVLLPMDFCVAEDQDAGSFEVVSRDCISEQQMVLDIGPRTVDAFRRALETAKTAFFHGALGATENPIFTVGTREVAHRLVGFPGFSAVGSDGLIAALEGAEWIDQLSFVSSGSAASLGFLAGHSLPGLEALRGGAT